MSGYAELHCVSNFTFLRGASHPGELIHEAHNLGYAALAITDECSMAGIVRAHAAAKKIGFRLIVGSEFRTSDGFHVVLLAPTQAAYAQICTLITTARRESKKKGQYKLVRTQLETGLSECLALWIPPTDPTPSQALWLRNVFGDRCWIAVELHRGTNDFERLHMLHRLGRSSSIPLVAAGDVHMHVRERRALQDTVTAIRHGCTIAQAGHRLFPNGERFLRPLEQLNELYPQELLAETTKIAERCAFSLGSLKYNYPFELVAEGLTAAEHLRNLVEIGVRKRWPRGCSDKVRRTIEKELALIHKLKYEHFFLTVFDIVREAKRREILCQGRGSAANSVVCYALGITEVSPDLIDTLFERFLSEERNEPPDIDVDFEHERREEIIQYVYKKYGRHRAALAATVITYQTRSAVRDVGKALGLPLDIVNRISKSHAYWDDWKVFQENLTKQGLKLDNEVVAKLCKLVAQLKQFPRHLSQHVGGFVISEEPVSTLVPMENAAMPDRTIIQWDKNDLESLEMLKVDVLALGMLTALRRTFALVATSDGWPSRMDQIANGDQDTYKMIQAGDTVGVFQIESRAQMSMLPRLRPANFYDLVIEIAIVRPGPIEGGMVHPYLERRKKKRENPNYQVEYPSEDLRPVLEKTLGVSIFQEQVMQIAVVAAGFTPGQADELRRAMGAWQRSGEMHVYKDRLLAGMKAKGYPDEFAAQIYKQIEGFGEYGFPESHSASFALLAYQSSWLKRHRPAAFIAGLINSQPMGFYQPAQLLEQAKRDGVEIFPVDVTSSIWDCALELNETNNRFAIRLGMRLIRGLREQEAQRIVAARSVSPFRSIADLAHRAQLARRTTQVLATSGAFRSLTKHRNVALWDVLGTDHAQSLIAGAPPREGQPLLPKPSEWEEMLRDYRQMRLTTGRHPLALLRPKLDDLAVLRRKDLEGLANGSVVRVCGLVTHLQHPQTAQGVVFASLEDETGINNIIVWPGVFERYRHNILQTNLMLVSGELQSQDNVVHIVAQRIDDMTPWIREIPRNSRDFH